jgi:hypothetical protein
MASVSTWYVLAVKLDATSSDGGAAVWQPQRLHDASHTMDTHRTPVITAPIG